jgi:hypothetical protein
MYSISISLVGVVPWLRRVPRIFLLLLTAGAMIGIGIAASRSFLPALSALVSIAGYITGPTVSVILVEWFLFRKANPLTMDPRIWDDRKALPSGYPALAACTIAWAPIILSMSTTWYVGPIAKHVGDLAYELGAISSIIIYVPLRVFQVGITNATSGSRSTNATLFVIADTNSPRIVSAIIGSNSTTIVLTFTERMNAASVQTLANYSVANSAGSTPALNGATLVNGTNVVLSFAGNLAGRYTVVMNNLRDSSARGNLIAANTTITVGAEYFFGMTSPWKYLLINTNEEVQSSFDALNYNDSTWQGPSNALLYVEDATMPFPRNTPLSMTDTSGNRINTHYFRKTFVAPVGATNAILRLRHVVDDGVVVHLNGIEVHRFNMPAGAITAATQASGGHEGAVEGPFEIVVNLIGGTNVLAAEVHQNGTASSDIVFGLEAAFSIPSSIVGGASGQPVEIVTQPRSRTNTVGSAASLYVTATGTGPLTYQWRRSGTNLVNQTNSTIILNPIQSADAGSYTVFVSNSVNSVLSQAATVTVTNGGGTCTVPQPVIAYQKLTADSIRLSWTNPTDSCGQVATFTLQQAAALTTPSSGWSNVTAVSPFTVFTTNGTRFFRLIKP